MIWTLPFHKELLDVAGFLDLHQYLKHYNFSSIREIGGHSIVGLWFKNSIDTIAREEASALYW